ncbi:DNA-binding transcriptional regulator, GntR family [Bosea sp. OK403]|uniref:GntR family transcriptional regulator n=1 Tax=Bosea sp. OK403 TaxID=1855286 RepID=UPI0008DF1D00|nr:GntR family transcriptional regulator [Bosea sp. OK403]SFH93690.1 DNA-binding transcriptional regulator, GntR family [Bosea sp. OK403]
MLDTSSPFAPSVTLPAAEARMDVATRRLRKAVIACELAPGDFIHEAALVERFSLGRAGIRVALTALSGEGFVSRHARQGWRIAPVDGALIEAMLDGRRRLEPSLAAQRLNGQARDLLISLLGVMESVFGRSEPAALATARLAERQLRDLLVISAGAFTRRWLGEIWDHTDRILRLLELAGHPVAPPDRRALAAALIAGDADAARFAITQENERFANALAHGFMAMSARLAQPAARSARRRTARSATATTDTPIPLPIPLSKEQQ